MKGRNPNVGRHSAGASLARSGIKPPARTGSASGSGVGTGVNQKSAARAEYSAGMAKKNDNGQIDQWVKQAPEPFRNSQPSANPRSASSSTAVSPAGYEVNSGPAKSASAGFGKSPMTSTAGVGVAGDRGAGREHGKVVGKAQPRKVGNVFNQPSAKFYGR